MRDGKWENDESINISDKRCCLLMSRVWMEESREARRKIKSFYKDVKLLRFRDAKMLGFKWNKEMPRRI